MASTAARLHKRSRSASSQPAPSPVADLKSTPFLRPKRSPKDGGLDLSRPAAENDLIGLGISTLDSCPSSLTDSVTRTRHRRSASSTSHFSTSSGLHRPTPLPPIRQTPLPVGATDSPLALGSDLGLRYTHADLVSDDERRLGQHAFDPTRRSGSISSATRLAGSYSQSSISLTSPIAIARARGDTLKSIDTATTPSSRTSFDHTYKFIRGGRDSPVDAASRAASIRAARHKFDEEQRARERKYEQEAHRQRERHHRKQLKREDHQRALSDTHETTDFMRMRTVSDTDEDKAPRPSMGGRPSVGGRQYSDHCEAQSHSLPKYVETLDPEKQMDLVPQVTRSRVAKGRWLRFVTWLRTRLLRMSGG